MDEVLLGKYIDTTLEAKIPLFKYDRTGYKQSAKINQIGVFRAGEYVGKVYSYVLYPFPLFMFYTNDDPENGTPYYTRANFDWYTTPKKVTQYIAQEQAQQEQQEIENQGAVPYYIEKYGTKLFLGIAAVVIISSLIKKQWK